jgi:response regulator RpfG family c-di-GMP phosphodiesterase
MDGALFLAAVRDVAPEATRMLLTGKADLNGVASVVNQGGVFRFLMKPVSRDVLTEAIRAGVEQHHLVTAERELLEQTRLGIHRPLSGRLHRVGGEASPATSPPSPSLPPPGIPPTR